MDVPCSKMTANVAVFGSPELGESADPLTGMIRGLFHRSAPLQ